MSNYAILTSAIDPDLLDWTLDPYAPVYDTTKVGTAANNSLSGNALNNAIYGMDGNDTLKGLGGNDYLNGGNGNDNLQGGDGKDILDGGAGNDKLDGGAGNDEMNGGDGNDTFLGGLGNDKMDGGAGNHDLVDYSKATSAVYVHLDVGSGGGYAAGDTYKNIEDVTGSKYDDTIDGDSSIYGNVINGGAGNDQIHGNGGYDNLHGGTGDDSITAFGTWNTGGAAMYGDAGNDTLVGGEADDYMYGGAGNDYIHVGGGVDTVSGGTGHDTIDIRKNQPVNGGTSNYVTITDFNKSQDILSLYDTYMGNHQNTAVSVTSDANGDVQLDFGQSHVVLVGVHNNNWDSVQDLTDAGFNITDTHW